MERTAISLHRLHATSLAIALLFASFGNLAQAAPRKAAPATAGDDDTAPAVPTARSRNTPVTLNFVNADIEAVSRAIGAMLDRQMLVDPRVKGTITVYNDKPQPLANAYRNYLAALRGLGFTVVESGGFLKVVPEADAKLQTGIVSVGAPSARGDQVQTQIFRLNHENPNNLVAVLRPLITANNTINASPGNNSLVITDYADNLQRLGKIITALDQPAGAELEIVPLKNAVASDIVQTVQKLIDGGNTVAPGIPGQGGATSVIVESRTNSLIVRASNGARMAAARSIIDKLDQPTAGGGPAGSIWVVYLKNADATKLAEVLRAAIGGGGGGSTGGSSSGSLTQFGGSSGSPGGAAGINSSSSISGATNSGGQSAQATSPVTPSARPSTGGMIQADPATNSLIITASEPLYRQMRSVIEQLDVRRAQVYVESLIVKVDATKAAEFGIQWQGLFGAGNSYIGGGTNYATNGPNIVDLSLGASGALGGTSVTGTATTTTSASSLLGNGLNIGFVPKINGIYTLAALAHFLETNVGGNVLSTPNLVALDNEEAKIVVGQNVPFVTGSFTNTGASSGSVNPFQTVERKDVGITLRIKSQVGENGTVRMTIFEENSTLAANSITDKSSVETIVTVDDGQLMVLGGLMKDEYSDDVSAVPLLSSIPVIGNLFKSQGRKRVKSNLMVFLRPVVLRTQADADKLSVNRYDLIRNDQQNAQPANSYVMPINNSAVIPPIKTDTRPDDESSVPVGTRSSATANIPVAPTPTTPEPVHTPGLAPTRVVPATGNTAPGSAPTPSRSSTLNPSVVPAATPTPTPVPGQ